MRRAPASHHVDLASGADRWVSEVRVRDFGTPAVAWPGDVPVVLLPTGEAVRATDDYVHENPWQSVGVAAGVAFLLGLLVSRR